MNPINDEMPSKDSTETHESIESLKDTKLEEQLEEIVSNEQSENEEKLSEQDKSSSINENSNQQENGKEENEDEKEEEKIPDASQDLTEKLTNSTIVNNEQSKEKIEEESNTTSETINEKTNEESNTVKKAVIENQDEESNTLKATTSEKQNEEKIGEHSNTALETINEKSNEESNTDTEMINRKTDKETTSETEITNENKHEDSKLENEIEEVKETSIKKNTESEKDANEENTKNTEENSNFETDKEETNLEADDFEDSNKETSVVSEPVTEDEAEEFEDVEDVEIPGEEDVDEIIVPDEAEAEDLTDGKDNFDEEMEKSVNGELEDEEERFLKESDAEENENETGVQEAEDETTKSSEQPEKEALNENDDTKEEASTKDFEDTEIEPEMSALEEEITNTENCIEQSKLNDSNLDEDTNTQASFDPLNCTGDKETAVDDEEDSASVKDVGNDNSNESKNLEKDDNEDDNDDKNMGSSNENENSVESQSKQKEDKEEDDDDDVQFVETRNSPICIESDDDDDIVDNTNKKIVENSFSLTNNKENNRRTITTATTTVTVPRNITVTRTSARKSTARTPQPPTRVSSSPAVNVPQIQNRTKSFNYLQRASSSNKRSYTGTSSAQRVVDCIELLDSSDEESSRSPRPQLQRTPQKRTLLGAKGSYHKNTNNNSKNAPAVNRLPHNFTPLVKPQPRKPAPPPLPPPTPQSNFLNAVQLQPASLTGPNPPAFSALLSNKNVIIPNAFYGNPPSVRGASNETEIEKRSCRWLENFVNQLCKPHFEPTHSCMVFLQRALKYKDFVRIKTLRANMTNNSQNNSNHLNIELMRDLKTLFFKNTRKLTNYGQRFCELTCSSAQSKAVALISHRLSGKVTLKTCNMELPNTTSSSTASNATTSSSNTTNSSQTRKRQYDEDEDEYTPDCKSLQKAKGKPPSENGDDDSGDTGDDRKRSLRTKRTKRIDNSFSYNEDDLLAEYEIDDADDEKLAQVEIQRKIEQKRLEAQQQRQQQVKSFESAFIQAFAKPLDVPTTSSTRAQSSASNQRIRLKNTTESTVTSIKQYTANNDAEDLLQATWIENSEPDNTQVISDDDEPQEYHIYKQQQEQMELRNQQKLQDYYERQNNNANTTSTAISSSYKSLPRATKRTSARIQVQEEFITDDDCEENNYIVDKSLYAADTMYWPKNIDPLMSVNGKNKDRCVVCNLNCQRLVHHYVNEHRGCEIYNSRLSGGQIKKLKQGNTTASVSLYKNGQNLYEAFCIFCNKVSRFMLRYWYQHYTMHTGEYAYRCSGCGVRKPTQSLLTIHHSQGCIDAGAAIIQDYAYDAKSMQIEAKICSLCNYVQLHRTNIVKHLHSQHNVKQILPKHIITVVLMKIPAQATTNITYTQPTNTTNSRRYSTRNSTASYSDSFIIEEEDNNVTYEEILPEEASTQPPPENHYYNYIPPYMQAALNSGNLTFENVDAGEDLSFMICGMLDVQMNANDAN